jgi:hypothetical protein
MIPCWQNSASLLYWQFCFACFRRKSFAGFALWERYAWSYFPVGIELYASMFQSLVDFIFTLVFNSWCMDNLAQLNLYCLWFYSRLLKTGVLVSAFFQMAACSHMLHVDYKLISLLVRSIRSCSHTCKNCPICHVPIEECMPVYDV